MANEEDKVMEPEDRGDIVVITDEAGNETYYVEEMVIPLDGKNFALLSPAQNQCDGDAADDDTVLIARVDFDDNGDPVYLDPTDEEFEAVQEAYEQIMDEMDEG